MQSKYLLLGNKPAWPIYKWAHVNLLWMYFKIGTAALSVIQQKRNRRAKKTLQSWKKYIIALIFNENTAWVETKVHVHMQKTAEPATNMHCSTL